MDHSDYDKRLIQPLRPYGNPYTAMIYPVNSTTFQVCLFLIVCILIPTCLLHVAMGRPLSSCATHFYSVSCPLSSCRPYSFMSSLMLPSHLLPLLGLLICLFPRTCMFNIFLVVPSSFFNTLPHHLSRLYLRKVVIGSMLASLRGPYS